jgi:peptidoglycan hydrolase-like protein with peptidoglycan-binding domain
LAALEPVTLLEGVQQRLNNLGYWCGDPHGTLGDGTRRALRKFQRRCGLTESGEADDRTRTLLLAVHCS